MHIKKRETEQNKDKNTMCTANQNKLEHALRKTNDEQNSMPICISWTMALKEYSYPNSIH